MPAVSRSLVLTVALLMVLAWLPVASAGDEADPEQQPAAIPQTIKPAELPPPDETRTMLRKILAQPEYSEDGEPDEKAGTDILQKIQDWLERLFGRPILGSLDWLGVGLVVAGILLVVYVLIRLYLGFTRVRAERSGDAAMQELPATAEALVAKAKEAAAVHDFRGAVRYLFNAAVKSLNMPSSSLQTNYQVLAFARRNHGAAESALRKLIVVFEDVWYGSTPCGQPEYIQSEQLYQNIAAALYGGAS